MSFLSIRSWVAALTAALLVSSAQADDWSVHLSADLERGKSPDRLGIQGARAKVGVGALVPQISVRNDFWGSFNIGYGYGIEPDWEAELGPVVARGDLTSEVFKLKYQRKFTLSDRFDVALFAEHRDYELEGTPEGTFNSTKREIDVDSKVKLDELGLKLFWHQSEVLSLFIGASYLEWSVDSTAYLESSDGRISASIELRGGNETPQAHLGAAFDVYDVPVTVELRYAELKEEKSTFIPELRISADLYKF